MKETLSFWNLHETHYYIVLFTLFSSSRPFLLVFLTLYQYFLVSSTWTLWTQRFSRPERESVQRECQSRESQLGSNKCFLMLTEQRKGRTTTGVIKPAGDSHNSYESPVQCVPLGGEMSYSSTLPVLSHRRLKALHLPRLPQGRAGTRTPSGCTMTCCPTTTSWCGRSSTCPTRWRWRSSWNSPSSLTWWVLPVYLLPVCVSYLVDKGCVGVYLCFYW